MIKVQVIEDFTLKAFNELKNVERFSSKNKDGELYVGDIFECSNEMCGYLTGDNPINKVVVKIIEVVPKKSLEKKEPVGELKEVHKETTPKATFKKRAKK